MAWLRTGLQAAGCGLGGLWLFVAPPVAAAGRSAPPPVSGLSLHVSPCLAAVVDESEIARLVAIELGPPRPTSPPSEPPRLHAQLDCSDGSPQLADLTVEERGSGRQLMRTVDLSVQAQPLHARLIALSLAELVHAVHSERFDDPPAPSSAPPPAPPPTPKPTSDGTSPALPPLSISAASVGSAVSAVSTGSEPKTPPLRGLYLVGGLALLVPFAGPGAPLHVGGGLRVGGDHRAHLGWDFDAQVQTAQRRTELGVVTSDLLSSRATLQAHVSWSRLLLRGGLGLRAGAVRLAGAPGDGALASEKWAPFGGPLLSLGLSFAPLSLRRLRADLTAEGGYLLWSATAVVGGKPSLAIAGPWAGLSLSLGLALSRPGRSYF